MRTFTREIALLASTLLAGAAIALAVGSPAQAGTSDCVDYLESRGYTGKTIEKGCSLAHTESVSACWDYLKRAGVPSTTAKTACTKV